MGIAMPPAYQRPLLHYGIAVLCVALALWLGLIFEPTYGDGFPFACMIVAVLVSGYRGGFGPGLVTSLLGALALVRFVIDPKGSWHIEGAESQAGILAYLLVTIGMAIVCGLMKRAVRRAELHTSEVIRTLEEKLQIERSLNRTSTQLERSDAFHRLITELTSDFTFRLSLADRSTRLEYVSPGFHAITGYSLDELNALGGWASLVLPDDLSKAQRTLALAAEGKADRSELRITNKSGSSVTSAI